MNREANLQIAKSEKTKKFIISYMSYAFEGVLCVVPFENIQSISSQISTPFKLKINKINDCLSCLSRVRDWVFSSEMEYVASQISIIFSKAILVRYDDRVGYRESILFQEGLPLKTFDLADEIWVMLDENGEPIVNGLKFRIEQIEDDDDEEYETICNAIQLGLESLGINIDVWKEVHSFITKPNWRYIKS
ncbi:MAG: hypothetical protein WBA39_27690 [Rivularia sp. (in: cyanobacteria)]